MIAEREKSFENYQSGGNDQFIIFADLCNVTYE